MSRILRNTLDDIAGSSGSVDSDHPAKVAALADDFHHTITFKGFGENGQRCFDYALGINVDLVLDARGLFEEFIQWYCKNELSEDPDGDLLVYFKRHKPKHGGVAQGQRIISKWGGNPIYEHGVMEIPMSYGDRFLRYRLPLQKDATCAFIGFVRKHRKYEDDKETFNRFESTVTELDYE